MVGSEDMGLVALPRNRRLTHLPAIHAFCNRRVKPPLTWRNQPPYATEFGNPDCQFEKRPLRDSPGNKSRPATFSSARGLGRGAEPRCTPAAGSVVLDSQAVTTAGVSARERDPHP